MPVNTMLVALTATAVAGAGVFAVTSNGVDAATNAQPSRAGAAFRVEAMRTRRASRLGRSLALPNRTLLGQSLRSR